MARRIQLAPPLSPLLISYAAAVMGDRRAEKRPMEAADLEAERRRERDLREKAKRAMHDRGDDRGERELRAAREERGTQAEPQGREGDWGPPPPWWIQQQQEKKQRKKAAQRRRELERKAVAHPLCGGGHGDPLAQQQRAPAESRGGRRS